MSMFDILSKWFRPPVVTPDPEPAPLPTPDADHEARRRSGQLCPIEAIDPATGETKFTFDSINAAGREGFCYQGVYNVLTGARKTYKGLTWRRCSMPPVAPPASETPIDKDAAPAPVVPKNRPYSVECLDPKSGSVIKRYPSLTAVVQDGFAPAAVRRAIVGERTQHGGYFWRMGGPGVRGGSRGGGRGSRIESFDPKTGETVKTYGNLGEAVRAGFVSAGVRNAVANGWLHHGLGWRRVRAARPPRDKETPRPVPNLPRFEKRRPVEAVDPTTGDVRHSFPYVTAAAAAGFDRSGVQKAIAGKRKTYRGLAWRYSPTSAPPARTETPEVASVLLTDALRRNELARLRKDVFFDENRHEWGVRLKGRTLYRPERHEVVRIWYDTPEQERRPGDESIQGPPPPAPPAQPSAPKQRLSCKKFARLEAFDPQTGRTVRVFNSVQDAARQGFNESSVYAARNHCLKTYKGYGWRVNTTLSKPVEARCPATGDVVFVFRTIEDIHAKDYRIGRIEHAIAHGNTYAHLHWRYAGDGETAPETSVEKVTSCNS